MAASLLRPRLCPLSLCPPLLPPEGEVAVEAAVFLDAVFPVCLPPLWLHLTGPQLPRLSVQHLSLWRDLGIL